MLPSFLIYFFSLLISPVCTWSPDLTSQLVHPSFSLALAWLFPQGYSGLYQLPWPRPCSSWPPCQPHLPLWLWLCWSYHSWLPQGKGSKRKERDSDYTYIFSFFLSLRDTWFVITQYSLRLNFSWVYLYFLRHEMIYFKNCLILYWAIAN